MSAEREQRPSPGAQPLATGAITCVEATVAGPGDVRVVVRATDGAGEVQTAERRRTLPDGATGHHTIRLRLREPEAAG